LQVEAALAKVRAAQVFTCGSDLAVSVQLLAALVQESQNTQHSMGREADSEGSSESAAVRALDAVAASHGVHLFKTLTHIAINSNNRLGGDDQHGAPSRSSRMTTILHTAKWIAAVQGECQKSAGAQLLQHQC